MILIISNTQDETANYLQSKLVGTSVEFVRFDTDTALKDAKVSYSQSGPILEISSRRFSPEQFSAVLFRRPERLKRGNGKPASEDQCILDEWSEAFEGYFAHVNPERWINHPARNSSCGRKLLQLTVARSLGLAVPHTILTQVPSVLEEFFSKHNGRIIVKPLGQAYIQRSDGNPDSIIYTNDVNASHLRELSDLESCPTFFQERINKECDVRITVVDDEYHAVKLIAKDDTGHQRCDIRRNNMEDVMYTSIELPSGIKNKLNQLVTHFNLRFAAIDMAINTDGDWVFFEINPNGQWAWFDLCNVTQIYLSFIKAFETSNGKPISVTS